MEALRKITVKEILKGRPPHDKDGKVIAQDLCVIFGKCREVVIGSTQFGDYREFIGRFEARQLIGDKKEFQATRLIVPPPTDDLIEQSYLEARSDDKTAEVLFAFVIGVEPFTRGEETKYRFTCRPVGKVERDQTDPLADLRAMLGAEGLLQLEAPKGVKAKEKTDA